MPLAKQKLYTYGDYLTWHDNQLCEIINGILYNMAPAPMREHQKISIEFLRQLLRSLTDKKCEVYHAPFDVRLSEADEADDKITTVVQPDISVICDKKKLDERGCRGAPDFIIEIVSPSTASRDHITKLDLYEKHGVKEYWIVQPVYKIVEVYILGKDGQYRKPLFFDEKGMIEISVLKKTIIDLKTVFL